MAKTYPDAIVSRLSAQSVALQALISGYTEAALKIERARQQITGIRTEVAAIYGAPSTGGEKLISDPVYVDGVFSAAKYQAVARQMGDEQGVAYLFGPSPSYYGTTGNDDKPSLFKRQDRSADEIATFNNPGMRFARPCNPGKCGSFQLTGGVPHPNEAGMYSSNMGQVIFIPSRRDPSVPGGYGVSDYCTWETASNVTQTKAEFPWQYYGGGPTSRNHESYRTQGFNVTYPVAIGRGEGYPTWGNSALIAHRDGRVTTNGQINSSNRASVQLADGLVPTSVCQLNSCEFGFVACWDTKNGVGKVAVIAQAGTPEGCYLGDEDNGKWWSYRGEWRRTFPGMPNYGNISFLKTIGYIDLPSDMRCPTSIVASTFQSWQNYGVLHSEVNGYGYDLRDPATRALFSPGGGRNYALTKSGVLMVGSKEEKKVCFIDLGPLIKFYWNSYLNGNGVGTVGYNLGQFPPTFGENASQKPTIIKTVNFDFPVTALRMSRYVPNKRAYIATQEGKLHIFDMGVYPLEVGSTGDPGSLREVGSVAVGRNPTWIGITARHAGAGGRESGPGTDYFGTRVFPNADFDREVIVCSRGDRKIQWVRFNESYTGGAIQRTAMDKDLADPIWVEDQENHTTEHYEVQIADYSGKLFAVRYGPMIWHDYTGYMNDGGDNIFYSWGPNGLAPNGFTITPTTHQGVTYNVENGGVTTVLGKPYMGAFANVY